MLELSSILITLLSRLYLRAESSLSQRQTTAKPHKHGELEI